MTVAIAATATMVALRWLLDPWLGPNLPFVTIFGAVAAAVFYGGWRGGLLATGVSFLACNYLFIDPRGTLSIDGASQHIGLVLYLFTCLTIIALGEAMRRARSSAAEEHERLRVTLASIGDAVITTDAEGRVVYMNAVACMTTGWSVAEAAGKPIGVVFRILHEGTHEELSCPVASALRDGEVVALANHTVLASRAGREIPIDDSAAPIRDADGTLTGCVLIFRDVSEQRQAQRTRARLASIVETSGDAILTKDLNGVLQTWNASAQALFGYLPEEVIGKPITILIPPDRLHEEVEILGLLRRGQSVERRETIRVAKDGRQIPVAISVSPLRDGDGRVVGASKIVHDATEIVAAREALAREKDLLATTLASIGDGVITTDAQACISYLNPVAETLTGWRLDHAVGRPLEDVFAIVNEATRRSVESPTTRSLREGIIVGLANHTVLIARDGAERPIDDSAAPIRDGKGGVIGCVLVFRDVTERRRADREMAASRERLRAILEQLPVGVGVADLSGHWTLSNPVMRAYAPHSMPSVSAQEAPRWRVRDARGLDLAPTDWPGQRALRSEVVPGLEMIRTMDDGSEAWTRVSAAPLRDESGTIVGATCVLQNVDDIRRSEQERDHLQAELAGRVEELAAADRRKNEFLATLAHELRNPLAPLRNSLEIMRIAGENRAAAEQARTTMERQVDQMVRLVDDLLDVARISRGRIELRKESVELASVVRQAVEVSRPMAERLRHELNVHLPDEPIHLDADPVRLAQILINLLHNACKYTKPGGRIWLAVEKNGASVRISVKDTGIGIPAEMLPSIFEMFTQVDQTLERSQGGLGIGLTLVKQLVEMHDGRVEAKSGGPGLGSEFVVELPVGSKSVGAGNGKPAGAAGPARESRRILVVDDNRDNAESLGLLLRYSGHDTRLAHDGMAAIEAADQYRPEVVLLDIGLPRLNGYDVCRSLRAHDWGREMTVIALTGWGQDDDRRKSEEAGFDHHLVKPVNIDALIELLAALPANGNGSG